MKAVKVLAIVMLTTFGYTAVNAQTRPHHKHVRHHHHRHIKHHYNK